MISSANSEGIGEVRGGGGGGGGGGRRERGFDEDYSRWCQDFSYYLLLFIFFSVSLFGNLGFFVSFVSSLFLCLAYFCFPY